MLSGAEITAEARAQLEELTMARASAWGLLGRMRAQPGKRDELIACLQAHSRDVPGKLVSVKCHFEQDDPDAFWINEVWRSKADFDACLSMPQVQRGMAIAGPLIAGMDAAPRRCRWGTGIEDRSHRSPSRQSPLL